MLDSEGFQVWLRKRAAKNPTLYGAVLAAEGREILGVEEMGKQDKESLPGPKESNVENRKQATADHDDEDRMFNEVFGERA